MNFGELKQQLAQFRIPDGSEVILCINDADIDCATIYLVQPEPACHPEGFWVVRIYGEEEITL